MRHFSQRNVVDLVDLVGYVYGMTTELLHATVEATAEKPLREIERSAAGLEREKLSDKGRLRVKTIKAAVAQLQQSLEALIGQSSVLPQKAGERIVSELQTAEGGACTGADLEQMFGLTPPTLHRRRKEHRVVFWRDAQHEFHYPRWQFTEAGALLPGVQEILETFRSHDEWRVMRYFLGQRKQLGGQRPLDLLRSGELDKVLAHARIHGEENTW